MTSSSKKTIYLSIVANVAICVAKLAAAYFTGSSAMFSEGIHSLVDTGNGGLLLLGLRLSQKPADETHPFGYGKELYFWTMVVALLVFAAGGGVSLVQGVLHVQHPRPLENLGWNYGILLFAFLFEGYALLVSLRAFKQEQRGLSLWNAIQASKDPTTFTVMFEEMAALVGLLFAFVGLFLGSRMNLPQLDGVASILIGVLLMAVAGLLARESKALLIGEGADLATLRSIRELAQADPGVERAGYPLTMYFGPHNVLLTMNVQFNKGLSSTEIEQTIDRIEAAVRSNHPDIRHIYLEADSVKAIGRGEQPQLPPDMVTGVDDARIVK